MGGEEAPEEWQGGLNLTYRLGPGMLDPTLNTSLTVYTHNQRATVYNVVATLRGAVEPGKGALRWKNIDRERGGG